LQSATACIEIYKALLAKNDVHGDIDASVPSSFQSDYITEVCCSSNIRYHVLIRLAHALQERYSHTGDDSDLNAALEQGQAALTACGTEYTLCPTVLVMYASLLEKNFERTGDHDELRTAESMCRQGLALCDTACKMNATAYHTLGWIMFRLYEAVGTPVYLDEALDIQRQGLDCKSTSHDAEVHQYLRALAVYTIRQYQRHGDPQYINEAMSFLEQALEICPSMHVDRMMIVHVMIITVRHQYSLSGRLEDLDKGVDLARQIMAASNFPRGDRRLLFLTAFANLLFVRYETALSTDCDLEEVIKLRREVFQCVPLNSTSRWLYAGNLASSLQLRFTRKGDLQDLEESIELCRHAIDLLPEGHPERPWIFSNLGNTLCNRFHEIRDAADLDEALVLNRHALAAISPSHTDYWEVSLAVISSLCIRFEVLLAVDDLDQAIQLSEGLLKIIPDEHIQKEDTVRHLAKALLLRGAHTNAFGDVDRAIRELVPFRERLAQSVYAPEVSRTLATSYLVRFRLNHDSRDAAHALAITNDLLDIIGPNHYERSQCLVHAADLYFERGTPFRDIAIALKYIAEAMSNNCRDVRSKIQGAKGFLEFP
jgi:tetratricopeptide (TPR) repeat protein